MNILFIKCLYLSNLGPFKGLNLDVFRGGLGETFFLESININLRNQIPHPVLF